MMKRLEDKTTLVSGAAGGIGAAIASAFADNGECPNLQIVSLRCLDVTARLIRKDLFKRRARQSHSSIPSSAFIPA